MVAGPGPQTRQADQHADRGRDTHGNPRVGKPEPLEYGFQGYWSRCITYEHRLIYKVAGGEVRIAACRYHYM